MLNLIIGPGNHHNQLLATLIPQSDTIKIFQYYPRYCESIYHKGKLIGQKYSLLLDLAEKIYGLTKTALKVPKHVAQYYYLSFFDWYISLHINAGDLIAWPQVSLFSIKKVKSFGGTVSLEYPMIHIASWQEIMMQEYRKWGIKKPDNLFSKKTIQRVKAEIDLSDNIVLLSSFAKATFIEYGISGDKLRIRNLEIDPLFKKKKPIRKKRHSGGRLIFLFVGRIDLLKGVHYLLRAFNELNSEFDELWLVGSWSKEIEQFWNKNENKNIIYLGEKSKKELTEIYTKADVLVLPSVQESLGLVILEALHFGLTVISSDKTGATDVKSDCRGQIEIFTAADEISLLQTMQKVSEKFKKK